MIVHTLIAGLAGARLTRAWSFEQIGEEIRNPIEQWAQDVEVDENGVVTTSTVQLRVKAFIDDLVACPYCVGFWLTLGCVIALRFKPTRPLVIGLAAAAIQSAAVDHYPGFDHEEGDEG